MNIKVQISLKSWFQFFWIYIQKWDCWITCSLYFNILKTVFIVTIPTCISTNSAQFPICFHPYPHLLSIVFLMTVILTDVRWYLTEVLICISLMISHVKLLFMCLLTLFLSSLRKYLFSFSANFLIRSFFCLLVWLLSYVSFYIFLYYYLIRYMTYKCFLPFYGLLFLFHFIDYFVMQRLFSLM